MHLHLFCVLLVVGVPPNGPPCVAVPLTHGEISLLPYGIATLRRAPCAFPRLVAKGGFIVIVLSLRKAERERTRRHGDNQSSAYFRI